ncbi:U4/U6 snRNP-associated protein, putative [Theileria annulata]|uniref:U4/U6 snRNP-associated protein, putative n=1 Tax=Theileria annulata TaxID=5874 RepID=Q4UEV0_THEAN|nr:U4/U6 snRNP-associated protein, putative [Theileria annulata]CAI74389.1 U4/U6 snRNP-associated protein, putative [Theileria annulata]|eukprot:XP_952121.1 U4/U6 snRNP-associated protein, putative [Theileria annulata]
MGTLADSFLADLEDLENEDNEQENSDLNKGLNATENFESDEETPIVDAVAEYFNTSGSSENSFSTLIKDPEINSIVEKAKLLSLSKDVKATEISFIDECNKTVIKIDKEIINIFNYVRDIYSKRFPKLESIVYSPLDYIAVVKRAQNESDFTKIDLTDLLPNSMIMAVTVASTVASGTCLSTQFLNKVVSACNEGLLLAEFRNDLLVYLEGRMILIAPNTSALIGSALTARIIARVGSVENLSKIPSQNLMMIGADKNQNYILNGLHLNIINCFTLNDCLGILNNCDLVLNSEPSLRIKALRLVCSKVSLASRIDLFKQHKDGKMGHEYRKSILQSLAKAVELPPAPMKKSLPVPEEKGGRKRGGRRHRKTKEKYSLGEFQKYRNRLKFGVDAEDDFGLEMGNTIYIIILTLTKKRVVSMQSSGATNGMSSSLIFTPLQGIELCNPNMNREVKRKSVLDNQDFLKVKKT